MKNESQQKSGLTITDRTVGDVQVLALAGYLDGHTFQSLERRLEALLKVGASRLVIELSGLTYIASAGVGAFINMQHMLKKTGGNLQLVKPSDSVREIFSILGLDSLFVIHETLESGLAAAQK